jgi:hypothetical protein
MRESAFTANVLEARSAVSASGAEAKSIDRRRNAISANCGGHFGEMLRDVPVLHVQMRDGKQAIREEIHRG